MLLNQFGHLRSPSINLFAKHLLCYKQKWECCTSGYPGRKCSGGGSQWDKLPATIYKMGHRRRRLVQRTLSLLVGDGPLYGQHL
jgi:hypothetical protein